MLRSARSAEISYTMVGKSRIVAALALRHPKLQEIDGAIVAISQIKCQQFRA
jgi:hypothetical protein